MTIPAHSTITSRTAPFPPPPSPPAPSPATAVGPLSAALRSLRAGADGGLLPWTCWSERSVVWKKHSEGVALAGPPGAAEQA
jgi:hypothetical protein